MAILRVVFPHTSADGERFLAGDLRELPDHQVEDALRPDLEVGFPVMALDPTIWEPAPEPGVPQGPPMPVEELPVVLDDAPAQEEPAADAEEGEKPARRGRR
jgi:hypothetical protein